MNYSEFLDTKKIVSEPSGFEVANSAIHPALYDFQRDVTRWALKRGRAAILADCGLGKTPMQLAWAQQAEQVIERIFIAAVGCGSQQHHVARGILCQAFQQLP